jgi:hypothetical protein
MRFWRRRRKKRLANMALLLVELEQLAEQQRKAA